MLFTAKCLKKNKNKNGSQKLIGKILAHSLTILKKYYQSKYNDCISYMLSFTASGGSNFRLINFLTICLCDLFSRNFSRNVNFGGGGIM